MEFAFTTKKKSKQQFGSLMLAGDASGLLHILETTDADVNTRDALGRTPLHVASSKGDVEILSTLLSHGANPNLADAYGNYPVGLAAAAGHLRCVTLLLQFGASATARDTLGRTPLEWAR
jgi:ankyrin repeat protein